MRTRMFKRAFPTFVGFNMPFQMELLVERHCAVLLWTLESLWCILMHLVYMFAESKVGFEPFGAAFHLTRERPLGLMRDHMKLEAVKCFKCFVTFLLVTLVRPLRGVELLVASHVVLRVETLVTLRTLDGLLPPLLVDVANMLLEIGFVV